VENKNMPEKIIKDKAEQKEIEDEIGRRQTGSQTSPSVEGSCSNPFVIVRDPFQYVAPIHENKPSVFD
jgi:hypothetical protein